MKTGLNALTKRQLEVLELVADGLSNPEIGQELFISERTVRTHLHEIFSIIYVGNRTAAARFVWEKRLEEAKAGR